MAMSLEFKELLEYEEDRSEITEFTWDVGIKLFEDVVGAKRKSEMYFLDGQIIDDEEYLVEITSEICREYGLALLDIVTDLVIPIGYGYPSLAKNLQEILNDALKPISKAGQPKTIVWIQDEYWKDESTSIMELFIRQLLLTGIEPFLIAPLKYFDQEVFAAVSKAFQFSNTSTSKEESDVDSSVSSSTSSDVDASWNIFASLVKLGFLLAVRSPNAAPLIVMHLSQSVAEKIDAFELLDLAESEGHTVKYLKNFQDQTSQQRFKSVDDFASKLIEDLQAKKIIKRAAVGSELMMEAGNRSTDMMDLSIKVKGLSVAGNDGESDQLDPWASDAETLSNSS